MNTFKEHRKKIRHGAEFVVAFSPKNHFKNAIDVFLLQNLPRKLHTPAKLTAGTQKWTWKEADVLVQSGAFQDVPSWELA